MITAITAVGMGASARRFPVQGGMWGATKAGFPEMKKNLDKYATSFTGLWTTKRLFLSIFRFYKIERNKERFRLKRFLVKASYTRILFIIIIALIFWFVSRVVNIVLKNK